MSARHLPALVIAVGLSAGFAHAALTVPPPAPSVECYEDGSCADGTCTAGAPCDNSTDLRGGMLR